MVSKNITKLQTSLRSITGQKGITRSQRIKGWIPAVLYGGKQDPFTFYISHHQWELDLSRREIRTRLFSVSINEQDIPVLVKDVQFHPVTDQPLHIDCLRLSDDQHITVSVPIHVTGADICPGVKQGGVLNVIEHHIVISCPWHIIPSSFEISIDTLKMGHVIHLSDISMPEGAHVVHLNSNSPIVTIVTPKHALEDGDESTSAAV